MEHVRVAEVLRPAEDLVSDVAHAPIRSGSVIKNV
jgi:hypothetical protein